MEEKFTVNTDLPEQTDTETVNDSPEEELDEFAAAVKARAEESLNEEPEKVKKKKKKSSGTVKSLITVLVIIVISCGLAFSIIYAGADFLGIGFGRGENCVVEIPEGASTAVIAEKLNEQGAVKIPLLFRLYSKYKHYDSRYKYGLYSFNTEIGYQGLADMLVTEGAIAEQVTVTVPETDIDSIAAILEEKGVCKRDDFIYVVQNDEFDYDFLKEIPTDNVYYRLEGYLYPDTYNFYASEDSENSAHMAVDAMLKNFDKKISEFKQEISEDERTLHEVLTMASIVQLEAGNTKTVSDEDRKKVAAVFYNRLESDLFSTLGSSPTRKYPHGDGKYNTYEAPGLPPGPLCSPNISSIRAALHPSVEMAGYYYFVTDAQMKFYYTKTLEMHNSTIARLKKEKNWIYED